MKKYICIVFFVYGSACCYLFASAEFRLPNELATASHVKLVVEDKGVESDIILKKDGQWVIDRKKQKEVFNNAIWLVFLWDGKRHAQILQVRGGSVIFLVEKVDLMYEFEIRIDKFLSNL
jgi:hypothetical protein